MQIITLTRENLHALGTSGIGFNRRQLAALGVTEMRKGWLSALIGKTILGVDYDAAMSLRGRRRKKQRDDQPKPESAEYLRGFAAGLAQDRIV